jgi:uncharacterized membrane protein YedE/YeeE
MATFAAWVCGLVFGLGLILSGMTDPARVLGFLDVAGRWDPSLGIVMASALAIATPAFALARRRADALLGPPMALPAATRVDRNLIAGATLFGLGWGLVGVCPGPAVVLLLTGGARAWVFALAMFGGMVTFEVLRWRAAGRT